MMTHNICFCGYKKNISTFLDEKCALSGGMGTVNVLKKTLFFHTFWA